MILPDIELLKNKACWVKKETLKIHKIAPETRIASSLSPIEIFVALFYGGLFKFNPKKPLWEKRDRLIISKGHGSVSLYPILADLGFFNKKELGKVATTGALLGGIPDPGIPGYETINGSLGHGLGVACGISLALKRQKKSENIFVVMGDGELFEGSVWEAIMFAGEHRLDNLTLIIDNNGASMLNFCKNIIDLEPLEKKFVEYKWFVERVDGHKIDLLLKIIKKIKNKKGQPKVIIADTIKGKGIPSLETDPLSHIKSISGEEIDKIIANIG
ncbi:MAG: 1-deoxy-D-xylulose-5-phosphate synthase N-terminal domain-containing protein [Elusimicrobiota bacterium]